MSNDPSLLDRQAFDGFAELFDAAELQEVIAEWHEDALTGLAGIREALQHDDRPAIGQIAHRAAGGALALGASGLAAIWEQLRAAAEAGRAVDVVDLDRVRTAIESTQGALCEAAGLQ